MFVCSNKYYCFFFKNNNNNNKTCSNVVQLITSDETIILSSNNHIYPIITFKKIAIFSLWVYVCCHKNYFLNQLLPTSL